MVERSKKKKKQKKKMKKKKKIEMGMEMEEKEEEYYSRTVVYSAKCTKELAHCHLPSDICSLGKVASKSDFDSANVKSIASRTRRMTLDSRVTLLPDTLISFFILSLSLSLYIFL